MGTIKEWDVISVSCRRSFDLPQAARIGALFLAEADQDLVMRKMKEENFVASEHFTSSSWLVFATADTVRVRRMTEAEPTRRKGHTNHVAMVRIAEEAGLACSA